MQPLLLIRPIAANILKQCSNHHLHHHHHISSIVVGRASRNISIKRFATFSSGRQQDLLYSAIPSNSSIDSAVDGDLLRSCLLLSHFRPLPASISNHESKNIFINNSVNNDDNEMDDIGEQEEVQELLQYYHHHHHHQGNLDRIINVDALDLSSVLKKKRKKMRKHKDRKRWKKTRAQRRRRIQIKKQIKLERESAL